MRPARRSDDDTAWAVSREIADVVEEAVANMPKVKDPPRTPIDPRDFGGYVW